MNAKDITHDAPSGSEVSSASAFNCDSTRCLVLASNPGSTLDHFALHDGDGKYLTDTSIAASEEPRWDRTSPNMCYYVRGNALNKMVWYGPDVDFLEAHTFTEYDFISGRGESEISTDGRYFVFVGGTLTSDIEDVFIYDLALDRIVSRWIQTEPFDGLKISGNLPLVSKLSGIWINDGSKIRQIVPVNGHACPATYQGRDQLLWCSNDESSPEHPWQNSCVMVDIETLDRRVLMNFGKLNYAMHISACDRGCLVSVFDPSNALPAQLWWSDYEAPAVMLYEFRTIIKKERQSSDHPKASLSRDGSRALFCVGTEDSIQAWMIRLDLNPVFPSTPEPAGSSTVIDAHGEAWLDMGSLPYDEASDLVCFNSRAKSVTVYRRKND